MLVLRYGWDVNTWLSSTVIRKVRDAVIHEVRVNGIGISALLGGGVLDPSPRNAYLHLGGGDYLMRMNILIDIYGTVLSELPREPWIDNDFAYQLPAYYWVLRAMISKSTVDVSPEDVVDEVMRGR